MRRIRWAGPVALALAAVIVRIASPAAAATKVPVVAAEDFWGSIARQLGGERADVKSIIDDPETHAHDYEPKPSDGAAFATARVAIVNGIGYDHWADDLLEANPSSGRKVVDVGDVVGMKAGGNPHQWYSPRSVDRVIDAITEALKQAAPPDAAYFDMQRQVFRAEKLKRYNELRAQIKAQFEGTPVGATESIFAPLAEDLGLRVMTPAAFQDAIAEGDDPTAADKATVDTQITDKQIKVLVYNSQNSTPDVTALLDKAKKAGIPVTTVTETASPKGTPFQDWQVAQLQSLAASLAQATGKTLPSSVDATQVATPPAVPAKTASEPDHRHDDGGDHDDDGHRDAAAAGGAPNSLARTGGGTRWAVLVAGLALILGGLSLTGAALRRRRSPLREA
jgi:zinc/manganese transport system substrate-binding protein